jgi:basic amino acid/polyamine antiporter, APA family
VTLGFGGYLSAATGLPAPVGAVVLVAACTALNLLGVKVSGRAQTVVVLVALGGLAGFAIWGLPGLDPGRLRPFAPQGAGGVLGASLLAFLSFGGFDMVAAAGEEVERPERNLPRAILLTLVSVLGLYLTVTLVAVGTLPAERLGASGAPLADAALAFGGPIGRRLILACALLTTAATANAVLVVTSRVVFAMARDGFVPARLAAVSSRTGAPAAAVVGNGLLMGAMAVLATVAASAAAGGFLYVLHFLPPLAALVVLRRRPAGERPAFATPAPRLVLPLAFAASAGLLLAGGRTGVALGTAWLLLGLAIRPRQRSLLSSFVATGEPMAPSVLFISRLSRSGTAPPPSGGRCRWSADPPPGRPAAAGCGDRGGAVPASAGRVGSPARGGQRVRRPRHGDPGPSPSGGRWRRTPRCCGS